MAKNPILSANIMVYFGNLSHFFYGKTSDATFRLEKFWQYCQIFGIHFSPCPRNQSPVGPKTRMHKVKLLVQSYLGTRQLQLVKSSTCRVLMRKDVSALGACSGLIALARACMSHNTAPQKKTRHHSVFVGFSTSHESRRN